MQANFNFYSKQSVLSFQVKLPKKIENVLEFWFKICLYLVRNKAKYTSSFLRLITTLVINVMSEQTYPGKFYRSDFALAIRPNEKSL